MATLNDWECRYDGLVFGGDTQFSLLRIEGLLDTPDSTAANYRLMRRHGANPGDAFMLTKTIRFVMDLVEHDGNEFSTMVTVLRDMSNPTHPESELLINVPNAFGGDEVMFNARPRRRKLPIDTSYLYKNTAVVIEFEATYPFARSSTEITTNMVLSSGAVGRTYNRTYNMVYGSAGTGGSALMLNTGNQDAEMTFTFTGPLTNPKVTLLDTGEYMEFDITLVTGQTLIVDTLSETVLLGGTASRSNTITAGSSWWRLPPTTTGSSVGFTAQLFEAGTLSATHRSTYV